VQPLGQPGEVMAGLTALLADPAQDELAADEVVADLFGSVAFGVEKDRQREGLCTYVGAYVGAAKLLTKLGVTDLAVVAADRAATIAVEADSLGARGIAAYQVAGLHILKGSTSIQTKRRLHWRGRDRH
jgi:hypothetical protein